MSEEDEYINNYLSTNEDDLKNLETFEDFAGRIFAYVVASLSAIVIFIFCIIIPLYNIVSFVRHNPKVHFLMLLDMLICRKPTYRYVCVFMKKDGLRPIPHAKFCSLLKKYATDEQYEQRTKLGREETDALLTFLSNSNQF